MTQNASDVEIANQGFAAFRQDLNDVLEDITTLHSGTAAPSTTYANQWWYETDTDKLYIRNEDNDAWVEILTIDQANDHLASLGASITLDGTGNVSIDSGDFTVDTDTLFVDSTNNRVGIGTTSPDRLLTLQGDNSYMWIKDAGGGNTAFIGSDGTNDGFLRIYDSSHTAKAEIESDGDTYFNGGNVGIGTDSPNTLLDIEDTTPALRLTDDRDITWSGSEELGKVEFYNSDSSGIGKHVTGFIKNIQSLSGGSTQVQGDLTFGTAAYNAAATEAMRIDSSGNLLVGQTSANNTVAGISARADGRLFATRDSDQPAAFNRLTNDGNIIEMLKDNTLIGTIGVISSRPYISTPYGSDSGLRFDSAYIAPCTTTGGGRDNAIDLGSSSNRFDDIYATNGTIQTSDQNEKQQIASLTAAEITAAKAISKLFKTFKWNSSVTENGDNARTHTGVIAQDVQQAMTDAGLDAGDYAFFISTTWWETQTEVPAVEAVEAQDAVYDEDGNLVSEAVEAVEAKDAYTRTNTFETADEAPEGATERTRLGIRYPELLAFIGAATEQRLADIETRLTALEAE